jgi:LysR family cys regulon transcriptional activator
MKLRQLQYICEVARRGLNVSNVAEILHTAQPGISTQIRLLEEELQVQIFERNGKRLVGMTQPGKAIIQMAEQILREVEDIQQVCSEFAQEDAGTFSIATTHTQARYALPAAIKAFKLRYPNVRLRIHQANPMQTSEMAVSGVADITVTSEISHMHKSVVTMPCNSWNFCLITPPDHPLLEEEEVSLEKLSKYPLVTYDYAFDGRSLISKAFTENDLMTNMALTAMDSDVIKSYVELGLGVGILADLAFDPQRDHNLRAIDASHLFESSVTHIGIPKGKYLRKYMYAFIELCAPHLTHEAVDMAMSGEELDEPEQPEPQPLYGTK